MWLTTLQNLLQNHSTTSTIAKSSRPWPILTGKKAKTTRYSRPPKWSAASVPVPDTPRGPMSITQWIEAFHMASGTLAHVLLIKIHIKTTKEQTEMRFLNSLYWLYFTHNHLLQVWDFWLSENIKSPTFPTWQQSLHVETHLLCDYTYVYTPLVPQKKCSKMCFLSIVRVLPVGPIMSGKYVEHYQNSTMSAWNRISRGHPRVKVKSCR